MYSFRSCSVMFRHVPSCSVMFCHVPSCSVVIRHVPSSSCQKRAKPVDISKQPNSRNKSTSRCETSLHFPNPKNINVLLICMIWYHLWCHIW